MFLFVVESKHESNLISYFNRELLVLKSRHSLNKNDVVRRMVYRMLV